MLFCTSLATAVLQLLLGWRMNQAESGDFIVGPLVDVAICLLMLGCVQSSVMTLLNHIGVSTMGDYAYTVRAAGSAGYMVAVMLMGAVGRTDSEIAQWHLFIGSAISLGHAILALAAWLGLRAEDAHQARKNSMESVAEPQKHLQKPSLGPGGKPDSEGEALTGPRFHETRKSRSQRGDWVELLTIVWLVAICEMSYGLYAHEFMTKTFGYLGYFVFSAAVAIEIILLLVMPFFPALKAKLLFVGPLGWLLLFSGCILATLGFAPLGLFGLALALNCPFQISTNEHAHRINPSVMGVASMTLAQSLGYVTATIIASIAASWRAGPMLLWLMVLPLAMLALVLAIRKLASQNSAFDVDDLSESSGVAGGRAVSSAQKRPNHLESVLRADDSGADAQDIHVVMLDPLPGGVSVVAKTGANPRELVGGNTHSNS